MHQHHQLRRGQWWTGNAASQWPLTLTKPQQPSVVAAKLQAPEVFTSLQLGNLYLNTTQPRFIPYEAFLPDPLKVANTYAIHQNSISDCATYLYKTLWSRGSSPAPSSLHPLVTAYFRDTSFRKCKLLLTITILDPQLILSISSHDKDIHDAADCFAVSCWHANSNCGVEAWDSWVSWYGSGIYLHILLISNC